tara:strand:- start:2517 stop:2909 length:393 start_codon:yes stop_codon:yes gene_type:complete
MMKNLNYNSVTLVGRITRNIELKKIESKNLDVLSKMENVLAVDASFSKYEEHTNFIPISLIGQTAENAATMFAKGKLILVEGELKIKSLKKDDGTYKEFTSVLVRRFSILEPKSKETSSDLQRNWETIVR